jgi:hypothetical protein
VRRRKTSPEREGADVTENPEQCRVIFEAGAKRTFASALDWPGWSRSGKDEAAAVDVLLAYADRYAIVVRLAGIDVPLPTIPMVVDRQPGDKTTDFGAPNVIHQIEHEPLAGSDLSRQVALLRACWTYFDSVSERVSPQLQKGPRGGGRDRDQIIAHVTNADRAYARKLGVRTPPFDSADRDTALAHREAVLRELAEPAPREADATSGWPVRYVVRRMAWHILDHAWEMEDKTLG